MPLLSLPQRDRKRNYDASESSRDNALGSQSSLKVPSKRRKAALTFPEYQFFDNSRIEAINDQEHKLSLEKQICLNLIRDLKKRSGKSQKKETSSSDLLGADGNVVGYQQGDEISTLQAQLDDGRYELPKQVSEERDALIAAGFRKWTRKDFKIFLDSLEQFGKSDKQSIVDFVVLGSGKSREEVEEYYHVFFKRFHELSDWNRIAEKIERGENKVKRQREIKDAINTKVSGSSLSLNGNLVNIYCGGGRGRMYSDEEDTFLIHMLQKHGYGNWEPIRTEILESSYFMFDWFIKSRNYSELQRRCETLVRSIEREQNPDDPDKQIKHRKGKQ